MCSNNVHSSASTPLSYAIKCKWGWAKFCNLQLVSILGQKLEEDLCHESSLISGKRIHIQTGDFNLKGHGNEADLLGFLHKPVRHRSLTLHFEPFRFWLPICRDIRNPKTTPQVRESTRLPIDTIFFKPLNRQSCRLPDLPSRGVVFRLRISPQIQSQNRNGSKGSVRNLWGTNFCKNPRKSTSFAMSL